jgi:hypothetical protein
MGSRPSIVEEAPENLRTVRVLELALRLGLDLVDALACHRELLADFLERVVAQRGACAYLNLSSASDFGDFNQIRR